MNRRELLQYGAGAASIAILPKLFTLPLAAQSAPQLAWNESTASLTARHQMNPLLAKYSKAKGVHSLTADEWIQLGYAHAGYFADHYRSGDLHRADMAIKANQAFLRTKVNHDELNYITEHGTYALLSLVPAGMYQVAAKLKSEPYAPATLLSCSGSWETFGVTALILGVLFPEIEGLMFLLGVYYYLAGVSLCP